MDQKHYTQIRQYRIYALLVRAEENFVYVGKTTAQRISGVYSRHRTGAVKATACYFDQEEAPELYLLETCNITGSEAYRRTVAWCHLFLQAGYASINHDGTIFQARNLLPETRAIVESLMQEPLEEILRKAYLSHLSDGNLMPEKKAAVEIPQKTIQMNIRIGTRDKERFDRFCQAAGVNQREGFSVLLDQITDSADFPAMARMLKNREEKMEQLKQEISRYQAKLEDQTSSGKSQKEALLERKLEFTRTGIHEYLQNLFPEGGGKASLPETFWRKYMRNLPEHERPVYPETEGFLALQPEIIVWGNSLHRPCFLVGKGEDGKRYLFRCYPRADFVGFPIRESCYAKPGIFWYVGCQKSRDGAMELMAAFPLLLESGEIVPAKRELHEVPEKEERKEALDKIIQNAWRKQQ